MKKFYWLLFGMLLTGCATMGTTQQTWIGQDFDSFVIENGTPTSKYKLQNMNTAYSFVKPCAYTQGQSEILVVVDSNNLIQEMTVQSRCPSAYEHKEYNGYVNQQDSYVVQPAQYRVQLSEKRKAALDKQLDHIGGELLKMGSESKEKQKVLTAEAKAAQAIAKRNAGLPLTETEKNLIQTAETARANYNNWQERYKSLTTQFDNLARLREWGQ